MEFAAVTYPKYGSGWGLRFFAVSKQIKMLSGLKSPEAQKILGELKCLGFEVLIDPAMTMMVEIEQSRRRSFFGRLSRFFGA